MFRAFGFLFVRLLFLPRFTCVHKTVVFFHCIDYFCLELFFVFLLLCLLWQCFDCDMGYQPSTYFTKSHCRCFFFISWFNFSMKHAQAHWPDALYKNARTRRTFKSFSAFCLLLTPLSKTVRFIWSVGWFSICYGMRHIPFVCLFCSFIFFFFIIWDIFVTLLSFNILLNNAHWL